MGGPWRERGFDATRLRPPDPRRETRAAVAEPESTEDRLTSRVVVAYIAALVMSFGLMLGLMHRGW
jgi:fatty acid desaturase